LEQAGPGQTSKKNTTIIIFKTILLTTSVCICLHVKQGSSSILESSQFES